MTPKIRILTENIANKIAAGEVVERPASVAKELLENAIDAGATRILVEISSGGKRAIRIADNGHGMTRDNALLALERHATSKIATDRDLEQISTLGFRGEALPSIASVSRLRLKTRTTDSIEGVEIFVEGGVVRNLQACGMSVGTDILVEQLFYNTPARLKFLKSKETEGGRLGDLLIRTAISRPDIQFNYYSDGKELLKLPPATLKQRVQQLVAGGSELFPVEGGSDAAELSGFITPPSAARSGTNGIFTYINGRFVRDRVVQHAVMQAYRPLLERGRYPLLALFIKVPPEELDVNVHPTKHEVRFRRQSELHDTIQAVLEQSLRNSPWLKPSRTASAAAPSAAITQPDSSLSGIAAPGEIRQPPLEGVRRAITNFMNSGRQPEAVTDTVNEQCYPYRQPASDQSKPATGYFSSLTVIGQFNAAYILCQGEDQLLIIDQHAAAERVRFQHLKESFARNGIESQQLLLPETVELEFGEVATLRQNQERLKRLGFELEEFGGQTWRIIAAPQIVSSGIYIQLLRDLLAQFAEHGGQDSMEQIVDELLSKIACHSVVRGRHTLDRLQMERLLEEMDRTDFSAHCPHGRPVSHSITLKELERLFHRR